MVSSFRFFSGKGGVGKTSCAAATALRAASEGRHVLVVSMDPAHSLGDALGVELGAEPRAIPVRGTGRLHALELDADAALDAWIDARRTALASIASRGTYLDETDIERFFRLSLPGVDELIGLVELERLAEEHQPDLVVVDTAPTGHTLRMLQMPTTLGQIARVLDDMQEKHRVIATTLASGSYESDDEDALIEEIDAQRRRVATLIRDPARTQLTWVCLPQTLSIEETEDGTRALTEIGVAIDEIVVNRVTPPPPGRCALCEGRRAAERDAVATLAETARAPLRIVPRLPSEPRGLVALRALGNELARADRGRPVLLGSIASARTPRARGVRRAGGSSPPGAVGFEADPELRMVLFGGKGGVGKTTCAAATAIAIAERHPDRRVLVLSTDPAHSLGDALDLPLGDDPRPVPGVRGILLARELDAPAELGRRKEDYGHAVDQLFDTLRGGARLDATYDRTIVHDLIELAPPGIDELFASIALLDSLFPGDFPSGSGPAPPAFDLVVVDTAPWGHTERLLELPESAREWVKTLLSILLKYRDVIGLGTLSQDLVALSRALGRLVETWRDPARTVFVPVTRAAALPRKQTERLVASLDRLSLRVPSLIVNAVRDRDAELCDRCESTRKYEGREIATLERELARARPDRRPPALILAPLEAVPPRGRDALIRWSRSWKVRRRG
jgi:arsenite-transporting ATPase